MHAREAFCHDTKELMVNEHSQVHAFKLSLSFFLFLSLSLSHSLTHSHSLSHTHTAVLQYESPWSQTNPINLKFQNKGGGSKQQFEKPSYKKRKLG